MGVSVSDEWLYQARIGGLPLGLSLFTPEGDGVTFREHLCAAQTGGSGETRAAAAARTHRLTDIARRHGLRYVHVTTDCVFERLAPEYAEDEPLSLTDPRSQAAAVAEIVAAGAPRHLIVRTGWVIGRDDSFVDAMVTA